MNIHQFVSTFVYGVRIWFLQKLCLYNVPSAHPNWPGFPEVTDQLKELIGWQGRTEWNENMGQEYN